MAFIRISTNNRAFPKPLGIQEAVDIVGEWLERSTVAMLQPGERHRQLPAQMLKDDQAAGPLAMDAHLAALAVEHGAALHTTDRDFSRFPGLKLVNPLLQSKSEK